MAKKEFDHSYVPAARRIMQGSVPAPVYSGNIDRSRSLARRGSVAIAPGVGRTHAAGGMLQEDCRDLRAADRRCLVQRRRPVRVRGSQVNHWHAVAARSGCIGPAQNGRACLAGHATKEHQRCLRPASNSRIVKRGPEPVDPNQLPGSNGSEVRAHAVILHVREVALRSVIPPHERFDRIHAFTTPTSLHEVRRGVWITVLLRPSIRTADANFFVATALLEAGSKRSGKHVVTLWLLWHKMSRCWKFQQVHVVGAYNSLVRRWCFNTRATSSQSSPLAAL